MPGCSAVTISQLDYRGVYSGSISYQQNYVTTLFNGELHGHRQPRHAYERLSFLDAGFAVDMRIRLEGLTGTTDFVVTDVSDTQLTLNGSPASGPHPARSTG